MTDRERVIVQTYTGFVMLTGSKVDLFYRYISELMGRPVFTHEIPALVDELTKRSKKDFVSLCAGDSSVMEQKTNGDRIRQMTDEEEVTE